ncbi:MAG: tetratricopeptide repeat protein [Anaerolineae bacterium]|nr:tetratricopeptide repeat protein [Anaerolineae bacterium]
MTSFADTVPSGRDDPLYRRGLRHLQDGEWEEAIEAFEALRRVYPESTLVQEALEQAHLRASVDAGGRVRARQVTLRIWPLLFRIAVIALIGYLVYTGGRLLVQRVQPLILQAREAQRLEQVMVEARAFLEGGQLEAAEARYREILAADGENEEALTALAMIEEERLVDALYREAIALDEAGDDQQALATYRELAALRPGFRDIDRRVEVIERQQSLEMLFAEANAAYDLGDAEEAIAKYQQLRDRNLSYERELVESRLVQLYFEQGMAIVEQEPPRLEDLSEAFDRFSAALALDPRNEEIGRERQLLKLYLEGQTAYYAERWTEAAAALRVVYDTRPDYLGDTVLALLYEAYVRSGDQYRSAGDSYLAYQQYIKAEALPVADKSFVEGRLFYVRPLLTPTPTPTPTATPRPEYAGPPATPVPLVRYTGRVVFKADYPNLGEIWVMNPDGTGRQRLGRNADLQAQFKDLEDQERYAPEGDRFAFVQAPSPNDPNQQIFLTIPVDQRTGDTWFTQLTRLEGPALEPAWSPDGGRLAFVSSAIDSDDIWIIGIGGENLTPLTPNPWEADRHPTWAPLTRPPGGGEPVSDRIIFWSDRIGLKQLYIMKADGSEVTNISNTTWDEYDPIWVK